MEPNIMEHSIMEWNEKGRIRPGTLPFLLFPAFPHHVVNGDTLCPRGLPPNLGVWLFRGCRVPPPPPPPS